ncbi:MAG: hypothetical protein FWG87_02390 [Defluviitaleaceae bacterium]|nr:hypothetical protein [Defluviitaleaceae bacterium]
MWWGERGFARTKTHAPRPCRGRINPSPTGSRHQTQNRPPRLAVTITARNQNMQIKRGFYGFTQIYADSLVPKST